MEKIKQFIESDKGKDILVVIIVVLVGLGSFELGRLSNESASAGIKIEYPTGMENSASVINSTTSTVYKKISTAQNSNNISGNYFASKIGHKYYSVGCTGGTTIKDTNKVWFNTEEEAQKAGYGLSSSCK